MDTRVGALRTVVTESPAPAVLDDWDRLVRAVPRADVAQLSGWGRVRGQVGFRSVHVLVGDGDSLVGGAHLLVRRLPGLGEVAYLAYGPLVAADAPAPSAVLTATVDALDRLGRERFHFLFVQPPEGGDEASTLLRALGFRPSAAGIAPRASLRLDLTVGPAGLKKRLSRRLKINRWTAGGVTTRPSTAADLPLLADLLARTARHQGFPPFDLDYLTGMHEALAPAGDLVGFVGEVHGRPVATMLLTACGGVLKRRLVGFERSDEVMRLNVPVAVDWAAIQWAQQQGFRWYDFGGIEDRLLPLVLDNPHVDVPSLPGPDRYKFAFGGDLYAYPEPVEMVRPAVLRATYDLALRTGAGRTVFERAKRVARTGSAAARRAGDAP